MPTGTARASWEATMAAFPLQSMATLHFEDVQICRHSDGRLWKLGQGGFGRVS